MTKLNGLVLAGGESKRMGYDKSLINFHGTPQRDFVFKLLLKFCDQVFTSCRAHQQVPSALNPLPDKFDFRSPLNGILTAFEFNSAVAWLTIPVDMPGIDENSVQHLIDQRSLTSLACCYTDSEGKNPEPLFAIWECTAFPLLKSFYENGKTSPRDFLKSNNALVIPPLNNKIHTNINSEDDLVRYRQLSQNI